VRAARLRCVRSARKRRKARAPSKDYKGLAKFFKKKKSLKINKLQGIFLTRRSPLRRYLVAVTTLLVAVTTLLVAVTTLFGRRYDVIWSPLRRYWSPLLHP